MNKCAFIFPGQSSQRKGMLQALYDESSTVRRTFEEASDVLGYDVVDICFYDPKQQLTDITINAPLIVTASLSCYRHMQEQYGYYPSVLAGHSLGEYAALTCSGAIAFEEVLPLVAFRSKLAVQVMQEQDAVMSVVNGISHVISEELCRNIRAKGGSVWISCYNSPHQVAIAGKEHDIATVEMQAVRRGAYCKRLIGNAPYHTPLMQDAVRELHAQLRQCSIASPQVPVISNVSAQPYTKYSIIDNLLLQLCMPVRWHQSIQSIQKQNINTLIELGSGQILTRILQKSEPHLHTFSYESTDERSKLVALMPTISRGAGA